MPDDTPTAKQLHLVRLVALGGNMSLEAARNLYDRATATPEPDYTIAYLMGAAWGLAGLFIGYVVGVLA